MCPSPSNQSRPRFPLMIATKGVLVLAAWMAAAPAWADRPDWIAQPKSADSVYVYVIGTSSGQANETNARDEAFNNARKKLARQIGSDDGRPLPASKIRGAEIMTGCTYVETSFGQYRAWVQVSWPVAEKNKLLESQDRPDVKDDPCVVQSEPKPFSNEGSAQRVTSVKSGGRAAAAQGRNRDAGDTAYLHDEASNADHGKRPAAEVAAPQSSTERKDTAVSTKAGAGGGAGDKYPAEPFNGMQVFYSMSGAAMGSPEDKDGFTCTRSFKGTLGSGSLDLSGSSTDLGGVVNTEYGNFAMILDAEVWVDTNKKGYHSKRAHEEGAGKPANHKISYGPGAFNLSVPIEADAKSGGFRISLTYVNPRFGNRGVVVCGAFSNSAAPGTGQPETDEASGAPSSFDTYLGKPSPQSDEEKVAWALYQRYLTSKKRLEGYLKGAKMAGQDISDVAYGFGAFTGIDSSDIEKLGANKEKAKEELNTMKALEDAWDKKNCGLYGPLSDSGQKVSTTVFDPKNPLELKTISMDVIEFRLRSYHRPPQTKPGKELLE